MTKSDEVNLTQWTGQFDQTNNHRLPNIEKDSFVHSENFGKKIHVAGVDSDMEVNQSSVVSDETTPDPLGVSQSKSTKQAEQKAECVEKQFLAVVEVYNRKYQWLINQNYLFCFLIKLSKSLFATSTRPCA